MKVTTDQVKHALIEIANQSGGPHYGMGIVREVVDAINEGRFHYLKNIVMQEIFVLYEHLYGKKIGLTAQEIAQASDKLAKLKTYYAGQKALVQRAGVNERTVSLLLRGKQKLTAKIWNKIEPVIDDVISELDRHHAEKERLSHGNYLTYRNGCRCENCKIAWRMYVRQLKARDQS